jgi:uncharacterized protein YkwD
MRSAVGPCRRTTASLFAACVLAALAFAAPAHAADCAYADSSADSATIQQLDDATVCLLNNERAAAGLQPLSSSAPLQKTAQGYADYMVSDEHFAHQDESGHNVVYRVLSTDPSLADRWAVLGENLGWGTYDLATPRAMVQGWMNSPTHRDNILYADYDEIGVGITPGAPVSGTDGGLTYTTVFGKVAPAQPAEARSSSTRAARNACIRRAQKKARRAHTKAARVRAARAKRSCLAKVARAARAARA